MTPCACPNPAAVHTIEDHHDPAFLMRENIAAKIRDAYYAARDHPSGRGTMHSASYDAADAVLALHPLLPYPSRDSIDEITSPLRHHPVVTASATPGVWNVYCHTCSAAAGDYVYPCQSAGGLYPPSQLVAKGTP